MPGTGLDDEGEHPLVVQILDSTERCCRVRLTGDLDLHAAPLLRQALDDAIGRGHDELLVDAAGVTFLDSSALMALLAARDALVAGGGSLRLTDASPQVTRLLEIVALTDLLSDGSTDMSSGEPPPVDRG